MAKRLENGTSINLSKLLTFEQVGFFEGHRVFKRCGRYYFASQNGNPHEFTIATSMTKQEYDQRCRKPRKGTFRIYRKPF